MRRCAFAPGKQPSSLSELVGGNAKADDHHEVPAVEEHSFAVMEHSSDSTGVRGQPAVMEGLRSNRAAGGDQQSRKMARRYTSIRASTPRMRMMTVAKAIRVRRPGLPRTTTMPAFTSVLLAAAMVIAHTATRSSPVCRA